MGGSSTRAGWRALALAIGVVLVASACGGGATPATTTAPGTAASAAAATATPLIAATISVSHPEGGAHLPLFYGLDKGIFDKYKIKLTLNGLGGGAPAMAALIGGQVQIADITGSNVLSATAAGEDLVVLAVLTPVYPYVLMANPDLKTTADLKGKTIAVKAIGDATDIAVRLSLKKLGLEADKDVTILAVNQDNARLSVLVAKQACCTPAQPRDRLPLEAQGFKVLYDLSAQGLVNSQGAIVVKRAYLNANKQVLQQFMDALIESIAAAKKDRAGALVVLKKQLDLTDDVAAVAEYDYFMGKVVPAYPAASPDQFKDAIAILGATNAKVLTVDPAKFIDNSFVKVSEAKGLGK